MLRVCMRYGIGVRLMAMASVFEALVHILILPDPHTQIVLIKTFFCASQTKRVTANGRKMGAKSARAFCITPANTDRQTDNALINSSYLWCRAHFVRVHKYLCVYLWYRACSILRTEKNIVKTKHLEIASTFHSYTTLN